MKMNNIINKIYKFMNGRYGVDELYKFIICICFIVLIINLFINSSVMRLIELILFFIAIYRCLSKNKYRRNKENKIYLNIINKIKSYYNYKKNKFRDRNTHMYKKCPKCKQKIRLPLKKGKHTVKCPSCREKFEVKCKKNEKVKVEIVK